jgi:NET1-associated nuclear protein 1 (U3 small nucleolar RNA-associated protein 17)
MKSKISHPLNVRSSYLQYVPRFVFLATMRGINVYSTSTSTLVRTLAVNPSECVAAYALSITHPGRLYIANKTGGIALWDWQNGKEILAVPPKWPIRALVVAQLYGTTYDTAFTLEIEQINEDTTNDRIVSRHFLTDKSGNTISTHVPLFWTENQDLLFLKVVDNGNVIFAASAKKMFIGNVKSELLNNRIDEDPLSFDHRYIWRILDSNDPLTCMDAKARPRPAEHKLDRSNLLNAKMYDLVCGGVYGDIYVYEDIIHKMEENETKQSSSLLAPRLMRWHREAVGAVKWSLDGKPTFIEGCTPLTLYRRISAFWRKGNCALLVAVGHRKPSRSSAFDVCD